MSNPLPVSLDRRARLIADVSTDVEGVRDLEKRKRMVEAAALKHLREACAERSAGITKEAKLAG